MLPQKSINNPPPSSTYIFGRILAASSTGFPVGFSAWFSAWGEEEAEEENEADADDEKHSGEVLGQWRGSPEKNG